MGDEWPFQQRRGRCDRRYCFRMEAYSPFGSAFLFFISRRNEYTGWNISTLHWHSEEHRVCFL